MSNIITQEQRPKFSVMISTPGYQKLINNTLKDQKRAQRFIAAITSAVAINPALQECDPSTILSGALLGESLGLSPSPQLGQYYLVPYDNKKKGCKDAQFQMGYKGIVQLAVRSGQFATINVSDVKAGELISRDRLTGNIQFKWIENEEDRAKAEVIGYVGYFRLKGGYEKIFYMSKEEIVKHSERYSKAVQKGIMSPWKDNFDAMAKKTVLKLMLNKGDAPLSIELQEAIKYDQSVIYDEKGTHSYVDNTSSKDPAPVEVQDAEVVNEQKPDNSQGGANAPY